MNKQREALKLALDALDCIYSPLHVREINKVGSAMVAIREALDEPEPEPQLQIIPSYVRARGKSWWRKPLTHEEITQICMGLWSGGWREKAMQDFARAIERAHGIGD